MLVRALPTCIEALFWGVGVAIVQALIANPNPAKAAVCLRIEVSVSSVECAQQAPVEPHDPPARSLSVFALVMPLQVWGVRQAAEGRVWAGPRPFKGCCVHTLAGWQLQRWRHVQAATQGGRGDCCCEYQHLHQNTIHLKLPPPLPQAAVARHCASSMCSLCAVCSFWTGCSCCGLRYRHWFVVGCAV